MDRSPPPFFKQGPSSNARLAFFALLGIALLVIDSRTGLLNAMRQGIGTVLYPLQRTLLVPRDALSMSTDYLTEIHRLRAENAELRRIETANARQLLQVEQLAQENRQLRELTGARDRAAVKSVVAEVLYDTRDPFTRKLVLDKGLQHGVGVGQPVVDAQGVVGQVTRVFPLSAELTLVTDRNMTIPVQVQRTGLRAIASGGAEPGRMELRYMSVNADLKEGDVVATSGLDSLYPAGLPVGRIVTVDRGRTGNFARVIVEPVAGVERSRLLLVLRVDRTGVPPPPPPAESVESVRGKRVARRD
ncbi:MAG TPA: rod shape-determining protein MreC [Burkholderiaceae bacterium]|nr:rod shape-determining protein MreC [Burkholderiaceae bacterium]